MDRDLALHFRNIAALIDGNVSPERFDNEVRTMLIAYGARALAALNPTDVLDDVKGSGALLRYSRACPSCYQDTTRVPHRADCEIVS